MKKKKYLPLYYKWMEAGRLPDNGLCNCFGCCYSENDWRAAPGFSDFRLMFPVLKDHYSGSPAAYWGCENFIPDYHITFTPLRQTIVLFLAAMNNEL